MTAIVFPTSPTLNQEFTAGDRAWEWNGTTWSSMAAIIVGPTGATGATGATGPTGDTGPQGLIGLTPMGDDDQVTLSARLFS